MAGRGGRINELLYAAVFGVAAPPPEGDPAAEGDPASGGDPAATSDKPAPAATRSGAAEASRKANSFLAGWEQYGLRHDL